MSAPGSPNSRTLHRPPSQEDLVNGRSSPNMDNNLNGNHTSSGTPSAARKRMNLTECSSSREKSVTPGPEQLAPTAPSQTRSGKVYEPLSVSSGVSGSASTLAKSQLQSPDRPDSRGSGSGNANATAASPPPSPPKGNTITGCLNYVYGTPYLKNLLAIIVLVISLMALSVALQSADFDESEPKASRNIWREKQLEIRKIFKGLHEVTFPKQPQETFQQIFGLVDGSLKKVEPRQPSAVVVLIPPEMHKSSFPLCFVRKLANLINRVFEPMHTPRVKGMDLKHFTKIKNVTILHEDLKDYFNGGGRAVVVQDVEKLDDENHLLVFHSFCDNSRAYQKRAIFFFLLPVPQNIFVKYGWNFRERGHIADAVLDEAWAQVLSPDKRPALISRVAGSSVLLNTGDSCVVSE